MLAFIIKKRAVFPLLEVAFCQKKKIWNFHNEMIDLKNQATTRIYDEHYLTFRYP